MSLDIAAQDPFAMGAQIGRWGAWAVCGLLSVAAVWLAVAPLNAAAIVAAQVKVETYRKSVQHLEGGQVQAVLVKAGDQVVEGQPLLRLSAVAADSSVQALVDQLNAERARHARALAERAGREQLVFPADSIGASKASASLAAQLDAERQVFQARQRQLNGQVASLRRQADQVRAELGALQDQLKSGQFSRKLIADELDIHRDLLKREFIQQTRVMETERSLAERDERLASGRAEEAKAGQKLSDLDLKIAGVRDDYLRRASDEASDASRRITELEERLRPLQDALARQIVRAPAAGEVVDLRVHGTGAVVAPRETLMEIVPSATSLVLEGKLRPEDVADVEVGQPVNIQLTAFRQRSSRMVTGTVRYVSADATTDPSANGSIPYFLIRVVADAQDAQRLPRALTAGMPAVLYVQTKARTALEYLLQPFTDAMNAAMRER
ncbi:HlyD family type I secretion periplasmic adaptor subunit [Paucibacter soli]|uniref:HlyD family type I secretion periplasmic adaptor subunit n=1 Tax=Paucibacter soli TaxID=3133433 RepID=UPI003099D402